VLDVPKYASAPIDFAIAKSRRTSPSSRRNNLQLTGYGLIDLVLN